MILRSPGATGAAAAEGAVAAEGMVTAAGADPAKGGGVEDEAGGLTRAGRGGGATGAFDTAG